MSIVDLPKSQKCRKMRRRRVKRAVEDIRSIRRHRPLILSQVILSPLKSSISTGTLTIISATMKELTGHRKMKVWQNIDQLDEFVQQILKRVPKYEFKTKSQIDNASDSIGANFVEGYYSGSIGEYIRFLRYSKRSLAELQERVRRILRKGYIDKKMFEEFDDLAIRTMYLLDRLIYSLQKYKESKK